MFSTPFDDTAVDLLESLGAPAYKVASFEIVDVPLIRRVAATGKPVIISTGMATAAEIETSVPRRREAGCQDLVLLECTTTYPVPRQPTRTCAPSRRSRRLRRGGRPHRTTRWARLPRRRGGAGRSVIEKHFTLARADGGVDSEFSMEPHELAALVSDTHDAWVALGTPTIAPTAAEAESLRSRRSLHVVADVRAGDLVTAANMRAIRPGGGLAPDHAASLIGRRFAVDAKAGTAMDWDLLAPREG